ncbi:MAG: hypothetical protein EOO51_09555 [Flavobacterium sp.]|nr:MAG: hypothetical protein EOO51_09555 [Flavobacterium sp.]
MENNQAGITGQEHPIANFSDLNDRTTVSASDDYSIFQTSDFYDEVGNYRTEAFEDLGSHHYMNYLHSHDDML